MGTPHSKRRTMKQASNSLPVQGGGKGRVGKMALLVLLFGEFLIEFL
jgi:hypothetical protein